MIIEGKEISWINSSTTNKEKGLLTSKGSHIDCNVGNEDVMFCKKNLDQMKEPYNSSLIISLNIDICDVKYVLF